MEYVIKLLCTIICEKLIDLGKIKSWYYDGSFLFSPDREIFTDFIF